MSKTGRTTMSSLRKPGGEMPEDQLAGRAAGMGSVEGQGRPAEWWRRYSRTAVSG